MKIAWEKIVPRTAGGIRFLSLNQQSFSGSLHAHEAMEITWIQSGQGLRFVAETVEPFGAGDLVLVSPEAAHTWISVGHRQGPARALVVQIVADEVLSALPDWAAVQARLWRHGSAALVIEGEPKESITAHLSAMIQASDLGRVGHALSILSLCAPEESASPDIRPLGTRAHRSPGPAAADRRHRMERLLRWTHQHMHTSIEVAEAARFLHVSPAAFSRAFKQAVGKPFTDYVNDLRIAQARLELIRSDRPVAEIAARCGFPTLSNFHEQFGRRTGESPRRYRDRALATRSPCSKTKLPPVADKPPNNER